jgi:hypothetical protein
LDAIFGVPPELPGLKVALALQELTANLALTV